MNSLLAHLATIRATAQQYPVATATAGSAGGFGAWLAAHGAKFITFFQLVGGLFGCLLAIVSFLFVLPRLLRFLRRSWRRGFIHADEETRYRD